MSKKAKRAVAAPPPAGGTPQVRISDHPRARAAIRRARGWAGVAGFALVALLALRAGVPAFDALARALAGGIVAHFATWVCAVALWRRLVVAELEAARGRLLDERASRTQGVAAKSA